LSKLQSLGIHNLIVDLDETLRKRNSDHIPEGSVQWIEDVKKRGFNVCITSNNPFGWQLDSVKKKLNVPVSLFALKPLPLAFRHAMNLLGSKPSNTALIGDQLFTDILGANLAGIYSILVDPITGSEKGMFRRVMRWLEQMVFPRVNLKL
ncbi:MAG: YqeG family HAD IIIA-type phosphatase, partial [bacterium]